MAGIKALRKIQLGREANAGTAVAATAIWRGMGTIEDTREVVVAEEDVGIIMGTEWSVVRGIKASRLIIDHIDKKRQSLGLPAPMYPVPYLGIWPESQKSEECTRGELEAQLKADPLMTVA